MFAGLGAVEPGGEHGVGAALDEECQPHLGMVGAAVAAGAAVEDGIVVRAVRHVQHSAVDRYQSQTEPVGARRVRSGYRPAEVVEQRLQRLRPDPLPGPGQGGAVWHRDLPGPQTAQRRPDVTQRRGVTLTSEQAQPEHHIDHDPSRQRPVPALAAAGLVDGHLDQITTGDPGQDMLGQPSRHRCPGERTSSNNFNSLRRQDIDLTTGRRRRNARMQQQRSSHTRTDLGRQHV
jgi:hypothetical protein